MLNTQIMSQHSGFGPMLAGATGGRSAKRRGSSRRKEEAAAAAAAAAARCEQEPDSRSPESKGEPCEASQRIGAEPRGVQGEQQVISGGQRERTAEEEEEGSAQQRRRRHLATKLDTSEPTGQVSNEIKAERPSDRQQHRLQLKAGEEGGQVESGGASNVCAKTEESKTFKTELVWTNIILFVILHSCLPIGVYMLITQRPWKTLLFSIFGMYASGLGVTGGSHRLWSHRAYKAKWPVQLILVALQTMAGQNSIYTWSRDHRVHHKFSETDADPHNIKRGFFFAHMGWLCCKKHPDVKERGKLIDMSDLEANPYVMFQHRHFWWMSALFTVLIPTMIPVLLWNERFWTSFVFSFMIRYLITLHGTWLVNSAAHYYGSRPYDTRIEARESPYVIYNALGEGFHNYHHTFPYDYATSEFGKYLNITTAFIDLCAALGLVEGRRKVDRESILRRRLRTGDLTEEEEEGERLRSCGQEGASRKPAQKSIAEQDESAAAANVAERSPLAPLNSIIHELPYISGLTSMKYTM